MHNGVEGTCDGLSSFAGKESHRRADESPHKHWLFVFNIYTISFDYKKEKQPITSIIKKKIFFNFLQYSHILHA